MRSLSFIFCFLVSFSVFARTQDIDAKLDVYVKMFKLKPLTEPSAVNVKLFRLGRDLFFEKNISGNKNINCAECHHPMVMTHDALPLALGEGAEGIETEKTRRSQAKGQLIPRNSPALFNLHNQDIMFADGRVSFDQLTKKFITPVELPENYIAVLDSALSAQALFPMVDHKEMRGASGTNEIADAKSEYEAWELIFKRIMQTGDYKARLEELFPNQKLNMGHVAVAIGHFEAQAFSAGNTAYDRYLKGDKNAMTEVQKIGMDVFFGKGKCGECHSGEHLSDFSYQNVGVPQIGPGKVNGDDFGRYSIDQKDENLYAFKVPGLRNVAMTAPYMHDGAFKTLAQVIEHYDDIVGSLTDYSWVNNYKSYLSKITGPLTNTNETKINSLSRKLSRKLEFEEAEEKALAEFIRGALTEKRFLDFEVSGEYEAILRIQLTEEGFYKIFKNIPGSAEVKETDYLYFDVFTANGYGLRELEKPVKIFITQNENGAVLNYRKQLFKTSVSEQSVVGTGTFEDEELVTISQTVSDQFHELNLDFFSRLYRYNDGTRSDDIPSMEKVAMKKDVEEMNKLWHAVRFKNLLAMSDDLNIAKEKLFFAPTSTNTKVEYRWKNFLASKNANWNLQKSLLRTETGAKVETWAVEIKVGKLTKKEMDAVLKAWLKELIKIDFKAQDAKGNTPSPSKLTEKVLGDLF